MYFACLVVWGVQCGLFIFPLFICGFIRSGLGRFLTILEFSLKLAVKPKHVGLQINIARRKSVRCWLYYSEARPSWTRSVPGFREKVKGNSYW
jgi:hypothetical protein